MNYLTIDFDISNGKYCGVSLFVSGCDFHCKGCFNPETWDYNAGKPWDSNAEDKLIKLLQKPYIKRLSILGGCPLNPKNLPTVRTIVERVRNEFGDTKQIWIYTGYKYEDLNDEQLSVVNQIDYLVDGQYEEDKRDLTLAFRGSTNQRIIEIN